jgi:hypothetical protein
MNLLYTSAAYNLFEKRKGNNEKRKKKIYLRIYIFFYDEFEGKG